MKQRIRHATLLLLLLSIALTSKAVSGSFYGTNVSWDLNLETGVLKIAGRGKMASYSISSLGLSPWYNNYRADIKEVIIEDGVTSIGDYAFFCCSALTSVTIPNSVTSIGNSAFEGCSGLTSVTIPNSVTSIGKWAFRDCTSLSSVTIPNSVTSIGNWAFRDCTSLSSVIVSCKNVDDFASYVSRDDIDFVFYESSLSSSTHSLVINGKEQSEIVIPNGVTSIGNSAFQNCSNIASVSISSSVTSIGNYAFYGCTGLASLNVDANNAVFCSINGALYSKDVTILFSYPCGATGRCDIPNTVKNIEYAAFSGCSGLTSVTIPNSVTSIGNRAFSGCSGLTSVTIPNSVTSIGTSAFDSCSGLTSVTIPNSVTSIGDYAFQDCSGLTSVIIPNSVTSIGNLAFYGCSGLTSVTIPNSVTSIGYSAFSDCSGLTSVTIPNSVTSIGSDAFSRCSGLTSVTIPNSVTSIGTSAFDSCSGLTSVTIPNSVTSIGDYAFYGCEKTEKLTWNSKLPIDCITEFKNLVSIELSDMTTVIPSPLPATLSEIVLHCEAPNTWISRFKKCTNVKTLVFAEGCTDVKSMGLTNVDSVSFSNTVTSISPNAFNKFTNLSKIELPNSLIAIGERAFSGCENLTNVVLPSSVESVGAFAFDGCNNTEPIMNQSVLAHLNTNHIGKYSVPEGISQISGGAFANCRLLTSVSVPESVNEIGQSAFANCTSLSDIQIAEGNKSYEMEDGILYTIEESGCELVRCPSKKTGRVAVKANAEKIASGAFEGCSRIESISFCNVKNIGENAFVGCDGLTSIYSSCQTAPEVASSYAFSQQTYSSARLVVPASGASNYLDSNVWQKFVDIAVGYIVNYVVDGKTYKSVMYAEGETIETETLPAKEGFTFSGWTGYPQDMKMPGNDLTISGSFTEGSLPENPSDDIDASTDITLYNNAIYFNDVEHRAGSFPLDLNMKNAEENITAFQCDVYLPEGVEWTYTTDKRGKVIYNLPAFNEDRTDNSYHTITPIAKNADGSYNIIVYSMDLETILETDGVLMTLPLEISEEMEAGEYNIILKNIVMTDVDKNQTLIDKMVSKLTIPSYQIGDANGDDLINVTDIVTTIAYIRGDSDPNFIIAAADTNEDGLINVTDIVGMIEIIRNTPSSAAPRRALAHKKVAKAAAESNLQVVPFTVAEGTTSASVKLNLNNPGEEFTAFQCDVVFPEGVKWETTVDKRGKVKYSQPTFDAEADRTDASYHTADAGVTSEGNINIMVYSMDNETILDEEGAVLDLPFVFDEGLAPGTYEITIKNIVLTRPDKTDYKPADYTFTILVGSPEVASASLKGNYTSEAVADYNKVLSANTSISSIDLTGAYAIDESSAISTGNKNAVIYVTEGVTTANASNLVVDGACASLALTDGYNFAPASAFTASSATYSRTAANEWGTICLPYAMQSDANVQLYQLKERQGDMLVFTAAESLEAGEPGVYKRGDNATFTVEASNAEIVTEVAEGAEAAGLKLVGSFAKARVDVDASAPSYYIKDNTFMKGNEYFNVGAFRAYFESDGGASAAALRIAVEDATGIVTVVGELDAENGVIYTLGGVKVKSAASKGVYIQNGKKIMK